MIGVVGVVYGAKATNGHPLSTPLQLVMDKIVPFLRLCHVWWQTFTNQILKQQGSSVYRLYTLIIHYGNRHKVRRTLWNTSKKPNLTFFLFCFILKKFCFFSQGFLPSELADVKLQAWKLRLG